MPDEPDFRRSQNHQAQNADAASTKNPTVLMVAMPAAERILCGAEAFPAAEEVDGLGADGFELGEVDR